MTVRILRLHLADGIRVRLPCIFQRVGCLIFFRLPFRTERYISICIVRSGCYDLFSLLQDKAELSGFQSCPCKSLMRMERCTSCRRVGVGDRCIVRVSDLGADLMICSLAHLHRCRDVRSVCDSFAFLVTALMNRVRIRLSDIALSIRQRIEHNSASCVHLRLKNLFILVLQLELELVFIRQFTAAHRLRDLKNRLAFLKLFISDAYCMSASKHMNIIIQCFFSCLSKLSCLFFVATLSLIKDEIVTVFILAISNNIADRCFCFFEAVKCIVGTILINRVQGLKN